MQLAVKGRHSQSIEKTRQDRNIPTVLRIKKVEGFLKKTIHGIFQNCILRGGVS
jgi:hypothetical protein